MPFAIRLLLWLGALVIAACSRQPACEKFAITEGERPGYSSFRHPNDTAAWSACSDGKTRTLRCTTGHWSQWKCVCSVAGAEKIKARSEKTFPTEPKAATVFANTMCGWNLK